MYLISHATHGFVRTTSTRMQLEFTADEVDALRFPNTKEAYDFLDEALLYLDESDLEAFEVLESSRLKHQRRVEARCLDLYRAATDIIDQYHALDQTDRLELRSLKPGFHRALDTLDRLLKTLKPTAKW